MIKTSYRGFSNASPWQRSLFSACSALLGYGVWAYLVNASHSVVAGLKAACVQGGYSFVLTLCLTMLIEWLHMRFRSWLGPGVSLLLTVLLTCALLFSSSWWINVLAGTPEVLATVLPGYVIGGMYTLSYSLGLSRAYSGAA